MPKKVLIFDGDHIKLIESLCLYTSNTYNPNTNKLTLEENNKIIQIHGFTKELLDRRMWCLYMKDSVAAVYCMNDEKIETFIESIQKFTSLANGEWFCQSVIIVLYKEEHINSFIERLYEKFNLSRSNNVHEIVMNILLKHTRNKYISVLSLESGISNLYNLLFEIEFLSKKITPINISRNTQRTSISLSSVPSNTNDKNQNNTKPNSWSCNKYNK